MVKAFVECGCAKPGISLLVVVVLAVTVDRVTVVAVTVWVTVIYSCVPAATAGCPMGGQYGYNGMDGGDCTTYGNGLDLIRPMSV